MKQRVALFSAVLAGLLSGVGSSLLVTAMQARRNTTVARPSPSSSSQVVHVDHLAEHRAAVREHDAQPIDRDWSLPMARSLTSTLSRLGTTTGFRVASVDCRTTLCVADLDWEHYNAALGHYGDVLHDRSPGGCSRETILPPPSGASGRYRAEVIFRCERSSAGQQSRQIERQVATD